LGLLLGEPVQDVGVGEAHGAGVEDGWHCGLVDGGGCGGGCADQRRVRVCDGLGVGSFSETRVAMICRCFGA
jgi:hypothetical protein